MPVLELHKVDRTKPESIQLRQFQRNETSQFGEDGVIEEILRRVGIKNRWCVEFGAHDGKFMSNTWRLIAKEKWSAVLIEGHSKRACELAKLHRENGNVHVQQAYVGWNAENSLDALLKQTNIPEDFDLLSIDVDGNDFHIWKAVSVYRPRVVVIEFNPTAPNDLYFVQDPDPRVNQGSSLRAISILGKEKGYELVATTQVNAFFVLRELFQNIGITDNSLDAMHDTEQSTTIAQAYDGTILVAGNMKLLWCGKRFSSEDLQILPKRKRIYDRKKPLLKRFRNYIRGRA